jgi:hypothetical protein
MHLGGTPLGDEIAPWVAELGAHVTRGMDAVALLSALKPTFTALGATATGAGLHVTGRAFGPDFGTAARFGPGFAADAVAIAARIADPPFDAYFACLGDLTGADIQFCPQFGLNVHGKMLFVLIHSISDISLVSDRNVFERLVIIAGSAYAEWAARQGPGSDALTVTADGAAVPIDTAGFFDVTVSAPGGHATLVVTTAAGDATSRTVP